MFLNKFKIQIPEKILRYIASDFRKAGAIAGVGLVGFVLSNDNIDISEALILVNIGVIFWILGLLLDYIVDLINKKTKADKTKAKEVL
ncbi:hypothetical protein [Gallibacterium salpingitidis]|uniref:hypothetical protein n=1 Tax=Gallibacterium salpingitidis TaxID=505341 RepID=UPI00080262A9|nr:hypothetical protein [Gallibacterium salpingitidis]WKS98600.1 hypothetical protein NYR30_07355 [Gallibacterium salpingitidis]